MPGYRRWRSGPRVFLTLVTADRRGLFAESAARAPLRDAMAFYRASNQLPALLTIARATGCSPY